MPLPVGLSGETQVPLQGSEAFREALLRLVALAPVERCGHRGRAAQLQGVDRLDDLVQVADHVGLVGGGQLQVTRFLSCRRHRQRRAGSTLRFRQSPISLRPPLAKSPVGRANLPSTVMHRREVCAWEKAAVGSPRQQPRCSCRPRRPSIISGVAAGRRYRAGSPPALLAPIARRRRGEPEEPGERHRGVDRGSLGRRRPGSPGPRRWRRAATRRRRSRGGGRRPGRGRAGRALPALGGRPERPRPGRRGCGPARDREDLERHGRSSLSPSPRHLFTSSRPARAAALFL